MQEARRFLRYVIPGLTFIVEVFIYLLMSSSKFRNAINRNQLRDFEVALTLFLASGAAGFLLSIIYYAVLEIPGVGSLKIDHTHMIRDATSRGLLTLRRRDNNTLVDADQIYQQASFRIKPVAKGVET
jgi:hypothetical protein